VLAPGPERSGTLQDVLFVARPVEAVIKRCVDYAGHHEEVLQPMADPAAEPAYLPVAESYERNQMTLTEKTDGKCPHHR
jgi:hypothetical protein